MTGEAQLRPGTAGSAMMSMQAGMRCHHENTATLTTGHPRRIERLLIR